MSKITWDALSWFGQPTLHCVTHYQWIFTTYYKTIRMIAVISVLLSLLEFTAGFCGVSFALLTSHCWLCLRWLSGMGWWGTCGQILASMVWIHFTTCMFTPTYNCYIEGYHIMSIQETWILLDTIEHKASGVSLERQFLIENQFKPLIDPKWRVWELDDL